MARASFCAIRLMRSSSVGVMSFDRNGGAKRLTDRTLAAYPLMGWCEFMADPLSLAAFPKINPRDGDRFPPIGDFSTAFFDPRRRLRNFPDLQGPFWAEA